MRNIRPLFCVLVSVACIGCSAAATAGNAKYPDEDVGPVQEFVEAPDPYPGAEGADFSGTASTDSAGITLAGATGAETRYTVDGASVNAPVFGRMDSPPTTRERLEEKRAIDAAVAETGPDDMRPAVDPPKADAAARHVLYAGGMQIAVFDVKKAKEAVEEKLEAAGGYVQSMEGAKMMLRIPAPDFRKTMDDIGSLGRVDFSSIRSHDITEEYEDLHTRITVLQKTHDQLLKLLEQARTVEEALKVRKQLDKVTLELERAIGRQRRLQSRMSFSVLALVLTERGVDGYSPSSNDPFPWVDSISVEATAWR